MHRIFSSPSLRGWALLLVVIVAAGLRFWQLGDVPPGFYRDEAFNGLDALQVLSGDHALFFPANNGREPTYIYLTAASVALFGQTVWSVRLGAAIIGTLTTIPMFLLARSWFGWTVGIFSAWLWAVSFWPVHLSRIGLRTILLIPLLVLAFWLGTGAFRRQRVVLWLGAGLLYAATFYTYVAARFTPVLVILLFAILSVPKRTRAQVWPGALWFMLGGALGLLPLAMLGVANPDLLLGRAQQVSILNPAVNEGQPWVTLWNQVWRSLGLYIWRGDLIWRHNLAGRPALDLFMLLPLFVGLVYAVRHWRRPAITTLLVWQLVMLGPTILAEDAPHFLRAVGALPALLILPALGLSELVDWPKLPSVLRKSWAPETEQRWRMVLILGLCLGTFFTTVRDYFYNYSERPETAFYFEAAARDLAEMMNAEPLTSEIFLDERYWFGRWPAITFLTEPVTMVNVYQPQDGLPCTPPAGECPLPFSIYAWPFASLDTVLEAVPPSALVQVQPGTLARGDLEEVAYPFFVRYRVMPDSVRDSDPVNFANGMRLDQMQAQVAPSGSLLVTLKWSLARELEKPVVAFVHVTDRNGRVTGQHDGPPGGVYWPFSNWQPGVTVEEQFEIDLEEPFDDTTHTIVVGLYDPTSGVRFAVEDAEGRPVGDSWSYGLGQDR